MFASIHGKRALTGTAAPRGNAPVSQTSAVPAAQGQPLEAPLLEHFTNRFGFDFSKVRIHTDGEAARSARAFNARAVTVGRNILFDSGEFNATAAAGRRLIAHELTHVVQQSGGGGPPGPAQELEADAASRAPESGGRFCVRASSAVGVAAQPRDAFQGSGLTGPLARYSEGGVSPATYEELSARIQAVLKSPGASRADGRKAFNRDPKIAKANLYNTHFHDDHDRLSFALGVLEAYDQGDADRAALFQQLMDYEVSRIRMGSQLVVHEKPTRDETRQLEQARSKKQVENARQWEADARQAGSLTDVTEQAIPAHENPDPIFTEQHVPRQPLRGSVPGYRFAGGALQQRDLLAKDEFARYASQWEKAHSRLFADGGMAPVVGQQPVAKTPAGPHAPGDYPVLGYVGFVPADSIYIPPEFRARNDSPVQILGTALASGVPAYAYENVGRPLQAHTSFGDPVILVTTDRSGKIFNVWDVSAKSEPGIVSVVSPIDFFGPGLIRSAGRAVGGLVADSAAGSALSTLGSKGARFVGDLGRKTTLSLGLAMQGAAELPALTLENTPAAFVVREEAQGAVAAQSIRSGGSELVQDLRSTEDVFGEIQQEMGPAPGSATRYTSTATAAAGAAASGLSGASSPGFQTHSTAPSVRGALGRTGAVNQSVHMVPQAVYRALTARGHVAPGGMQYSAGRALTTVDLSLQEHRAFDSGWVPLWNAAVRGGQAVSAGQLYQWLSNALAAVPPNLINPSVRGAMLDRIRSELFVELGLNWSDLVSPP